MVNRSIYKIRHPRIEFLLVGVADPTNRLRRTQSLVECYSREPGRFDASSISVTFIRRTTLTDSSCNEGHFPSGLLVAASMLRLHLRLLVRCYSGPLRFPLRKSDFPLPYSAIVPLTPPLSSPASTSSTVSQYPLVISSSISPSELNTLAGDYFSSCGARGTNSSDKIDMVRSDPEDTLGICVIIREGFLLGVPYSNDNRGRRDNDGAVRGSKVLPGMEYLI